MEALRLVSPATATPINRVRVLRAVFMRSAPRSRTPLNSADCERQAGAYHSCAIDLVQPVEGASRP
jgi:hypothetical protein